MCVQKVLEFVVVVVRFSSQKEEPKKKKKKKIDLGWASSTSFRSVPLVP